MEVSLIFATSSFDTLYYSYFQTTADASIYNNEYLWILLPCSPSACQFGLSVFTLAHFLSRTFPYLFSHFLSLSIYLSPNLPTCLSILASCFCPYLIWEPVLQNDLTEPRRLISRGSFLTHQPAKWPQQEHCLGTCLCVLSRMVCTLTRRYEFRNVSVVVHFILSVSVKC